MIVICLTLLCAPFLLPFLVRFSIRLFGTYLQQKTRGRRDLLLSRAGQIQEENTRQYSASATEDPDWEKVDRNVAASAPNGATFDATWHGVVGFFHPFW
jgi:hypothetical protein